MRHFTALLIAAAMLPVWLSASAAAQHRPLAHPVFYQDQGFALGGYDPVSFFLSERPLQGQKGFALQWKGAVWLFATAEHQAMFEANPRAFAPRYGGYCAYGVGRGNLSSGDPLAYEIHDGALYMMHSQEVLLRWRQARDQHMSNAEDHWPDLLRE